ncbi:hypothetical protein ASPZODRAFT_64768 [Penicilliopsis zonata CBS 506.65]|uniref:G protein-coupled receptor GPR1/2/3 C-terminal domain-containing protein n=1 Tax=Penicilliopsis zonata CBS 506.65 TaxID=1073090 RepID=A0A1L9SIW1_9EURO|nr:hypothetical protein ASPZODRAFT_64768 [Penicilliopsis zonata CBS 506.65]OJJ47159.1 hypothetical protein ASPZODRAFT_64768 [Penicilliopsis zonata CBS 506.65]
MARSFADLHVSDAQRTRFIVIGVVALCSVIATLTLASFLLFRFIFWKRYYRRPLAKNQYVLLIFNLLLADLQQSFAFMICLKWAAEGNVRYGTLACKLQGWWIQVADPGSGLFVLAIALHTGAVVLRGRQLPFNVFVSCIIALWAFIFTLGFIPIGLYGADAFVISEAGWCWLSPDYENERLWGHYFWIFLSEFGTIALYGFMFFYLRRRMRQNTILQQNQTENLKRLNRVVVYMVIYPFVYVVLSLPLAAGRMMVMAEQDIPSHSYFAVAGTMMTLSGCMDVLVYTVTRRHLLLETDLSTTDKQYANTNSNVCQTHISTTANTTKKGFGITSRIRRKFPSIDRTLISAQDNRNGSTDEIVQKGDTELFSMAHAVYQETTIEISHEHAQPEPELESTPSRKRGRNSR